MQRRPTVTPLVAAMVALPVLLIVGVLTFAGPCAPHEDGTLSVCASVRTWLVGVAAVGAVAAVIRMFAAPNGKVAEVIDGILLAAGVCVAAFPGTALLPLCGMATMRCHTVMRPFALLCGIALAAVCVADYLVMRRARSVQG